MANSSQQLSGRANLGYVSDEIVNLPGTVSANDGSGKKLEESPSKCLQK